MFGWYIEIKKSICYNASRQKTIGTSKMMQKGEPLTVPFIQSGVLFLYLVRELEFRL